MAETVRVAVLQARPAYYDLAACIEKACGLIAVAAARGAQLAVLGETFFPGYPAWLDYAIDYARWDYAPTKRLYARLVANSLAIDSPQLRQLRDCAAQHRIVLLLGIAFMLGWSMYKAAHKGPEAAPSAPGGGS